MIEEISGYPKIRLHYNSEDLSNQTFGYLTVLYPTNKPADKKSQGTYWLCKCNRDNNYIVVRSSALKSGGIKSCGCLLKENRLIVGKNRTNKIYKDLKNQTFGHLTVLEQASNKISKNGKRKYQMWKCQCDCDNHTILEVDRSALISGAKTHCECQQIRKKSHSKGEDRIKEILQENNINFIQEKTFDTCRFLDSGYLGYFDFYLPGYNCLIEYDGIVHFNINKGRGWDTEERLQKTKEHDNFKNQWCKDNNILLIRIPYTHFNDLKIIDLLPDTSNFIYVK